MADIDCVNAPAATCNEHLSEASGGSADVEADAAGYVEREFIERGSELDAPA